MANETQTRAKVKMNPESRWMHRALIGHHMDMAEMHGRAMMSGAAEHREMHRGCIMHSMDRAMEMAGHLRDALDGEDGDEDDMRAAPRVTPRALPEGDGIPADVRAKFRACMDAVGGYDIQTVGAVCRAALGTDDPDKVDASITAAQGTQVRYRDLIKQKKAERQDAEGEAREAKVAELEAENLILPAHAKRAREERWSLTKLASLEADARRDGPPVEITRVRALDPVEPVATGARPTQGARPLAQPSAPARGRGEGRSQDQGDAVAQDVVGKLGARLGLDPARTTQRFQKQEALVRGDFRAVREFEKGLAAGGGGGTDEGPEAV